MDAVNKVKKNVRAADFTDKTRTRHIRMQGINANHYTTLGDLKGDGMNTLRWILWEKSL